MSVNRRGFMSLLAGAAGAPLVPWRGLIEPLISLPPHKRLWQMDGDFDTANLRYRSTFSNRLGPQSTLTQESLEEMIRQVCNPVDLSGKRIAIRPTHVLIPAVGTIHGWVIGREPV